VTDVIMSCMEVLTGFILLTFTVHRSDNRGRRGRRESVHDVRLFKQLSGYRAKQLLGQSIWQISYYDHVVRRDEDLAEIMRYIWNNPVRAGLTSEPADYPYSGPRPLAIADEQA
jgi:REP element-mobilizing transposase RayT